MAKAGAKGVITAEPLDFSGYPAGRAARRLRFTEEYVITPKGVGAREPMDLRAFQREIIRGAFARGIRQGLVSMPRANGKTALAAALAVAELWVGDPSPEVLVVASDERQAGITLRMAKRMIELNPLLAERAHIYQDRIVVPENDGLLRPLPADPAALHGWDPSLLIVDELHTVTEPVWEAVSSMTGKRPQSLTLAISTPATSPDSIMWRLVQHGRDGEDRSFYLKEYAAPEGCDVDDEKAWRTANPALSCRRPFLALDGLRNARGSLREPTFRQLRLGQWVTGADRWLPFGRWDDLADPDREVPDGTRIVAAFDGSASGDSTVLIACTLGPDPHVFPIGVWESPGDKRWRVPRAEVGAAVDSMFNRYDVVELACDPWGWRSEIESWSRTHGKFRVVEYNTALIKRMAPATDRFYQAVIAGTVTHDGDERLARHLANAHATSTAWGDSIHKDRKNSPRKIDAAVGAIVALDRAAFHTNKNNRRTAFFR